MYYILKKHYYYGGALGAPKDGPIRDAWGDTIEFDCLEEAKEFILWDCGTNLLCIGENRYQSTGIYNLREGEYDRPDYEILKLNDWVHDSTPDEFVEHSLAHLVSLINKGGE